MAKIGLPKGSRKRLKVRDKSVKSQGILKWILSGNPDAGNAQYMQELYKICKSCTKYAGIVQNMQEMYKVYRNCTKCAGIVQNMQELYKICRKCTKYAKL